MKAKQKNKKLIRQQQKPVRKNPKIQERQVSTVAKSTSKKCQLSNSNDKSQSSRSKSSHKKGSNQQIIDEEDRRQFLPGQKYKTPDEDSGALAFYKSLYEQNPNSDMARRYCLEYGVLEYQEAKKVLQKLSQSKLKK